MQRVVVLTAGQSDLDPVTWGKQKIFRDLGGEIYKVARR